VKNARLNIVRLGAIVRKFIPNLYGVTSSRLHGSLPTDRLVAQWYLDSPRVLAALAGNPLPASRDVRVTVPANASALRAEDPEGARKIQSALREAFQHHFSRGYAVTGFEIEEGNASYLLEPYEN